MSSQALAALTSANLPGFTLPETPKGPALIGFPSGTKPSDLGVPVDLKPKTSGQTIPGITRGVPEYDSGVTLTPPKYDLTPTPLFDFDSPWKDASAPPGPRPLSDILSTDGSPTGAKPIDTSVKKPGHLAWVPPEDRPVYDPIPGRTPSSGGGGGGDGGGGDEGGGGINWTPYIAPAGTALLLAGQQYVDPNSVSRRIISRLFPDTPATPTHDAAGAPMGAPGQPGPDIAGGESPQGPIGNTPLGEPPPVSTPGPQAEYDLPDPDFPTSGQPPESGLPEGEVRLSGLPGLPDDTAAVPHAPGSLFDYDPSSLTIDDVPDDLATMFGGDRDAALDAMIYAGQEFTPDVVREMADSGDLLAFGIEPGMALSPDQLAGVSSALGIAGLVLTGLSMAGVIEGSAVTIVGNMLSLMSGAIAISQFASGLVQLGVITSTGAAAMSASVAPLSTLSAVGAVVGGVTAVLAPFIAWGMHELEVSMRPNLTPAVRRANEALYNSTTDQVNRFNTLVDKAMSSGKATPAEMALLMQIGENALLGFYKNGVPIGMDLGIPSTGGIASPSGQVGGFDAEVQGEMMAPYRKAAMNLAALDQMTGSTRTGSQDWYANFGGQLNPWTLNEALYGPGSASHNPIGLNPAQYTERFTPTELQRAAGGLSPFDFALQQWKQASPDWAIPAWAANAPVIAAAPMAAIPENPELLAAIIRNFRTSGPASGPGGTSDAGEGW